MGRLTNPHQQRWSLHQEPTEPRQRPRTRSKESGQWQSVSRRHLGPSSCSSFGANSSETRPRLSEHANLNLAGNRQTSHHVPSSSGTRFHPAGQPLPYLRLSRSASVCQILCRTANPGLSGITGNSTLHPGCYRGLFYLPADPTTTGKPNNRRATRETARP